MTLPETTIAPSHLHDKHNRLFISAEGFEERSLAWIRSLDRSLVFSNVILCKYEPARRTRLDELLKEVQPLTTSGPKILAFHRFAPAIFEQELGLELAAQLERVDEVVVDISVMSKLLIMVILWQLRKFSGSVRIVYTEPSSYHPTKEEYDSLANDLSKLEVFPSFGVHNVVRTPELSSVLLQRSPILLCSFTSFNEQLIRALLASMNPSKLCIVASAPPRLSWREKAAQAIHAKIISEFSHDNPIDSDNRLVRRASTLDYKGALRVVSDLYAQSYSRYRFVLAPTGSKMQAVGLSLLKMACPDIHIEFPTPKSFHFEGYSSKEIHQIHQVYFDSFEEAVREVQSEIDTTICSARISYLS